MSLHGFMDKPFIGQNRLILMVKEPCMGRVKTRLARGIGAAEALRFYRTASDTLMRRLGSDRRWQTILAVTPDRAVHSRSWPGDIIRVAQGRGDLGQRMERMLRAGDGPAVLIGSDIPAIRTSHIAEAFKLLQRNEAVFGPAEDGGFWLVGLKNMPRLRGLFSNVRWSSEHALNDVLANLKGHRIGFAASLCDVDDAESYRRAGRSFERRIIPASSRGAS